MVFFRDCVGYPSDDRLTIAAVASIAKDSECRAVITNGMLYKQSQPMFHKFNDDPINKLPSIWSLCMLLGTMNGPRTKFYRTHFV